MKATHSLDFTRSVAPVLYFSFELSTNQWKMASTTARGQQPRVVSVPAGDLAQVLSRAKDRQRRASRGQAAHNRRRRKALPREGKERSIAGTGS
jgi:hypothetical protein